MKKRLTWPVLDVHAAADGPGKAVVLGVPLPQGQIADTTGLAVRAPSGCPLPTACRALVNWPDGSVRWALLAFMATETGRHALAPTTAEPPSAPPGGVRLTRRNAGALQLDNGLVQVTLAPTGPGPVSRLAALGRPVIAGPADLRLCVDRADTTREISRTLAVMEESPVRVRVRVAGAHVAARGRRRLSYRLDVELWVGSPGLRLDYQFFNLEPGSDSLVIDRIAVELDLAMAAARTRRHFEQSWHGVFQQPRQVLNPGKVAIVTDSERVAPHVEDPTVLLDDTVYPGWLDPPPVNSSDWLGVTDGRRGVYLHLQDLTAMPPKRLLSEGHQLQLEVWPRSAGSLQLPQGRSRRQVITLAFADECPATPAWIRSAVTLPHWEGRATVAPEWLAACGEFEQAQVLPFGRHARFEKFLSRTVQLNTPADMFDLGDTPDSGYSRSYPSQGLNRQPRRPAAPVMPRTFLANSGVLAPWCDVQHYEPVWTNNEYDGIHALASELMRTGKPGLWPVLRWLVRHNIEVDFTHYSAEPWLHRISPVHSARHSTSGGYPSHFWTQGLMEYYCLTGDPDVLEVATALGDAIIRFFHDPERGRFYRSFDRENGWALLALVHLYDMTRETRFGAELDRLCEFILAQPYVNGDAAQGYFALSYVRAFYFVLNYIEGLDLYQRLTGRQDLADWLVRALRPMVGQIRTLFREGGTAYSTPAAMAVGYERTGDPEFLAAGMLSVEDLVRDDPRWLNPIPETKPMAVTYRAFIRFLGHAWRAGLLDGLEYRDLAVAQAQTPRRKPERKKRP